MPDVMNICTEEYSKTWNHNLCQDSRSYISVHDATEKVGDNYIHINYSDTIQYCASAVLILEAIPKIVGAARVCDPPRYHIHQIIFIFTRVFTKGPVHTSPDVRGTSRWIVHPRF